MPTDKHHTNNQNASPASRRLASLDGLRAISIFMVLVGHLNGTRGFPALRLQIGDYAHLGVVIFFVISGFLITSLLMQEYEANERISLQLFYARRSLRIFPASYAYLGIVCIISAWGVFQLQARDIWHALTYTVNFLPGRSWQIGHLWSLSVEEQFYLLWPLTFSVLGPRKSSRAAWSVVIVAICARIFNRFILIGTPYHDLEMFPMVADSLAAGCLLARLREWLEGQGWYLRLFRPSWSILLLSVVLLLNRFEGYTVVNVFGTTIINFGIAILVHRSVYRPDSPIARVLNWKPVVFVGVLSYSLYLWQQLFLNRSSGAWFNMFPQNLLFAVGAALASYFLLEKPLFKLRHRLRAKPRKLSSLEASTYTPI